MLALDENNYEIIRRLFNALFDKFKDRIKITFGDHELVKADCSVHFTTSIRDDVFRFISSFIKSRSNYESNCSAKFALDLGNYIYNNSDTNMLDIIKKNKYRTNGLFKILLSYNNTINYNTYLNHDLINNNIIRQYFLSMPHKFISDSIKENPSF